MIKKGIGTLMAVIVVASVAFGGDYLHKMFLKADDLQASNKETVEINNENMQLAMPEQSITPVEAVPQTENYKKLKAPLTDNDITGDWVHTFVSLTSNMGDGGCASTITTIAGTDSIEIRNLWISTSVVRGKLDRTTGKLTIPRQTAFVDATYGPIYISPSDPYTGSATTGVIEGTFTSEGLSIPGIFGFYVSNPGEYQGAFLGVCFQVNFVRPNAYMTATSASGTLRYGVIAEQISSNVLTVKNFGNYGREITINLNRNKVGTIASQVCREDAAGEWITIADPVIEGGKLSYYTVITTNEVTNKREITWGGWSMFAPSASRVGTLFTSGKIELPFDLTFPTLTTTKLTGKGTQDDPYLIKSIDELIIMADSVNNNKNYNIDTSIGVKVSSTFDNKYFRVENDIDMAGYTFEPIGKNYYQRFNGIVDGKGKKIKNLMVNNGVDGYAGLFGYMDSLSVVKNLTFEDANVKTGGFASGALGAYSLGTIINCHAINSRVESKSNVAGGLVGSGYIMEDCSSTGAYVTALNGLIGGLAGQVRHSIKNSYAKDCEIWASSVGEGGIAGGLMGTLYMATATDCWFTGTVNSNYSSSSMYLGGIAGVTFCSSMERCFSVARILGFGQPSKNGGVTGYLMGSLRDCYSAGTIQCRSSYNTGGIAGTVERYQLENGQWKESEIHNCYTSCWTDAEKSYYDPTTEHRETIGRITGGSTPIIENIYADRRMCDYKSEKYLITTDQMTSAAGLPGFDSKVWLFQQGQYPRLRSLMNNSGADLSASVMMFPEGATLENLNVDIKLNPLGETKYNFLVNDQITSKGHFAEIKDGKIVLNSDLNIGTDTLYVSNGNTGIIYFVKVAPRFLDGEGTAEKPFLIKTKEDLIRLAEAVTVKNQLYADTYFKFANDIDMEYDQRFLGIACSELTANKFSGKIDGDGHTIHRMKNHFFEWTTRPENSSTGIGSVSTEYTSPYRGSSYAGLIGRLALDGEVRNLTIAADCEMISFASTGAFVGDNLGLVENCINEGTVKTFSMRAGGIVASNSAGGRIIKCLNTGLVQSGYNYAGGIVGMTNGGEVEECINIGDVGCVVLSTFQGANSTGHKYAGGIAGNSVTSTFKNCINYGNIYTLAGITGGLVARLDGTNSVISGLSLGVVDSPDKVNIGAIGGSTGSSAPQKGYWDASILNLKAACNQDVANLTGISTEQLISGKALEGLDAEIWDYAAGQYPTLKQFANHDAVKAARNVVAKFPEGSVAYNFNKETPLSTYSGLTWKLHKGNVFKINNNVLSAGNITKMETDTLIATYYNGFTKKIYLQANVPIPLTGEGTEKSPYLVRNTDEWNELSSWMSNTNNNLAGTYVRLEADLDFKGKTFKPMCADNVTYFNATFLGNNKKITGAVISPTADYAGLFGTVGVSGEIRDLEVESDINSSYQYSGGVCGRLLGKLNNVVCNSSVVSNKNYVGGMVGLAGEGSSLTKCIFRGNVEGSMSYIGGVCASVLYGARLTDCGNEGSVTNAAKGQYAAGVAASSLPATYMHCYNKGTIDIVDTENGKCVAGIIAYANGTTTTTNYYQIIGCYNTSELYAYSKVAGIVGATGTVVGGNKLMIDSCYNTGYIHSVSSKSDASAPTAGIISVYSPGTTIKNSYNTGIIESEYNLNVAGIAGMPSVAVTSAYPVNILDCYNTGEIIATLGNGAGIVASLSSYCYLSRCYNTAPISGGHSLGGIVGAMSGAGATLTDCYNTGDITSSLNRAGGLIGNGTGGSVSAPTKVTRCWNSGDVSTTNSVGGTVSTGLEPSGFAIGGLAGMSRSQFANCYNTGNVSGPSQVGGLVGQPFKSLTSFSYCYNTGIITADPDTCGSIVGVNASNGRMWDPNVNKSDNVYYLKDQFKSNNEVLGEGLSKAELAKVKMGGSWVETDDYTFPMIYEHDGIDVALFNATQIFFAEGEEEGTVTKPFNVGHHKGVEWTIDAPGAAVEGTDVKFHQDYNGDALLKLTCGELSREYKLKLNVVNGIGEIGNDADILEQTFFNVNGIQVPKPEKGDGKIYIVIVKYTDGKIKTFKLVNN